MAFKAPETRLTAATPPLITVRDATLAFLRSVGLTTVFGYPGSTELPKTVVRPTERRKDSVASRTVIKGGVAAVKREIGRAHV